MRSERGDIILRGLLRTVAGLLIVGLVVFEVGSVIVNRVQIDDAARTAARAAAQSWAQDRSTPAASQAALESLSTQRGVTLDAVDVTGDTLSLTVTRAAPVLVIDQVEPLSDYARASVTKTASVAS